MARLAWPAALDAYDAAMMVELVTKPLAPCEMQARYTRMARSRSLASTSMCARASSDPAWPFGLRQIDDLRLIAGLDSVSSGTLTRGLARDRASIGFVFQDPTLMPWASVFDNVFLGCACRGSRGAMPRPL